MRGFSAVESLLAVISSLVFLCCVGLIVITWLSLTETEPVSLNGRMTIVKGAFYSEGLRNSSSFLFKALAYDTHSLVSAAFRHSDITHLFTSCQVQSFSPGSVRVLFSLSFNQLISPEEAELNLRAGLKETTHTLTVDPDSIHITELHEETPPPTAPPTAAPCPPHSKPCSDRSQCVAMERFCDGVRHCLDGSDEDKHTCATQCDRQFELTAQSGSFTSTGLSNVSTVCRWIIRVAAGMSIRVDFSVFDVNSNMMRLYEGVGGAKRLTAELTGSAPPGIIWLLSDQSTVEFLYDDVIDVKGFSANYRAEDLSHLSDEQKLSCTFEQGMCFWRQSIEDDGDWIRTRGQTFPPFTGPSEDHTYGNHTGFYLVTPFSPLQNPRSFRIHSLKLTSHNALCLSFWYHMYGQDVLSLRVLLGNHGDDDVTVFQRSGNYGDAWLYGQLTLDLTNDTTVTFEAQKNIGMRNDIALDDITVTSSACGPAPPDPTTVPPPTTTPPLPSDCGGPFNLYGPNGSFSSPNYPVSYADNAKCKWTLHAPPTHNIQLIFLDLNTETSFDMLEVRDGTGTNSTLLGVFTGRLSPAPVLFSSTNQMTVWLFSDSSGSEAGFKANYTTGINLGVAAPCAVGQFQCVDGSCIHGDAECDGHAHCPDQSDERDCVLLQKPIRVKHGRSVLTVCSHTWSSQLTQYTCIYLGYRSGNSSLLPALPSDPPFTNFTFVNGTIHTGSSDSCPSEKTVSLLCDNQPCGVRQVFINSSREMDQSEERTGDDDVTGADDVTDDVTGDDVTGDDDDDVRIVGGVDAQKGAWPWMVSLQWRGRAVCGASLIGSDWIVTAAHCVYGKDLHLESWAAILGVTVLSDVGSEVQTRRIDQIIINKNYNRLSKEADIAMMHLDTPANFTNYVQPVCLPVIGRNDSTDRKCFIAGWGREAEGGSLPVCLQQAQVPILTQTECVSCLSEYTITENMLCAGYKEGGVDSCQGDSGGPLMCLQDGHWTLIGVTSFGQGCGRPMKPGVYVRVSQFTQWITHTRKHH